MFRSKTIRTHDSGPGIVPVLLSLTAVASSGIAQTHAPGAPPTLPPLEVREGVSLDQALYRFVLEQALLPQNVNKADGVRVPEMEAHASNFNSQYAGELQLVDFLSLISGIHLPGFLADIDQIVDYLTGLCGALGLFIDISVVPESVAGIYELRDSDVAVDANGLRSNVTCDVYVACQLRYQLRIGNYCSLFTRRRTITFGYRDLSFETRLDWSVGGEFVPQGTLLTTLDQGQMFFDAQGLHDSTAHDLVFDRMNQPVAGSSLTLSDRLDAFARDTVPSRLADLWSAFFGPYVPGHTCKLSWAHASQNALYSSEGVDGSISDPDLEVLDTHRVTTRLERVARVRHDDTVPAAANPCAPEPPLNEFDLGVRPPFEAALAGRMGIVFLSMDGVRQSIDAARICGVGWRTADEPTTRAPRFGFNRLVPECPPPPPGDPLAGHQIEALLTRPDSPIAPVPLSPTQVNDLVRLDLGDGRRLGELDLHSLELLIEMCPLDSELAVAPFGAGSGFGEEIENHMLTLAIVETATNRRLMQEELVATYRSRVIPRVDRLEQRIELHGIETRLVQLRSAVTGQLATDVDGTTAVHDAPISLLSRAFFGRPTLPLTAHEPRVPLMIDGLTWPLVAREVGVVRLPDLSFPRQTVVDPNPTPTITRNYFAPGIHFGFRMTVPALCPDLTRWGARAGVRPDGSNAPRDEFLVLEVQWSPVPLHSVQDVEHAVTPGFESSTSVSSDLSRHPSCFDDAYVWAHARTVVGDRTRMLLASGNQLTPGEIPDEYTPRVSRAFVCATPAGYERARMAAATRPDILSTVELVPYRNPQPAPTSLTQLMPFPTDPPPPAGLGHHHRQSVFNVFEALAFRTESRCSTEECNSERLVWVHRAPLFQNLAWQGGDEDTILGWVLGGIRVPPDDYEYGPCVPEPDGTVDPATRSELSIGGGDH